MNSSCTRRHFLAHTGSLVALSSGLVFGGKTTPESADQIGGIIDTHVHFYDPTRPQGVPWPGKNDTLLYRPVLPKEFEEHTRPHGVEGTIVVEASKWFEDNQWVLDLAAENPVILGLVGRIDPDQPEFSSQLEKLVGNPLFLGLRMGNPSVGQDLKRFSETGRVLDVIVRWEMLPLILKLAETYPSQKIVLEHFTVDFSDNPKEATEQHRLLKEVAQAPNIYAKISNVIRKRDNRLVSEPAAYTESLEELWALFGEDRVMFGSNWPVSDRIAPYSVLLDVVRTFFVKKGPEACAKYFSKNSQHIYGWKARTEAQKAFVF